MESIVLLLQQRVHPVWPRQSEPHDFSVLLKVDFEALDFVEPGVALGGGRGVRVVLVADAGHLNRVDVSERSWIRWDE